jgi:proteasome accessory factor C
MRRVLAIVPWIVANPDHLVSDVASRFGISEKELLDDLSVVYMVGLPPYSPDALVDVQIDEEGRVAIRLADFFSRPLRLTPGQALALVASSEGLLSVPGTDPDGALARAMAKLRVALGGAAAADRVDIDLGSVEADLLEQLRQAAATATEVEIDYYSYNRDVQSTRRIAPWWIFSDSGAWYVHAWCHQAEGERIFRVDRIEASRPLGHPAAVRPEADREGSGVFHPRADHPRVTLDLQPEAAWVVEHFPCEVIEDRSDGTVRATLVVTGQAWLERLLVQVGPAARVVGLSSFDGADRLAAATAGTILSRYR